MKWNFQCSLTNHFRVRNVKRFREWAQSLGLEVSESSEEKGKYRLRPGAQTLLPLFDCPDDESPDPVEQLARHLARGSTAVVLELTGRRRAVVGGALLVVDFQGRRFEVELDGEMWRPP